MSPNALKRSRLLGGPRFRNLRLECLNAAANFLDLVLVELRQPAQRVGLCEFVDASSQREHQSLDHELDRPAVAAELVIGALERHIRPPSNGAGVPPWDLI